MNLQWKKAGKKKMSQTGFEPTHAVLYSLGDTELNHQCGFCVLIWTFLLITRKWKWNWKFWILVFSCSICWFLNFVRSMFWSWVWIALHYIRSIFLLRMQLGCNFFFFFFVSLGWSFWTYLVMEMYGLEPLNLTEHTIHVAYVEIELQTI